MVDNTEQDDGIIELTQLVEEDLSDGSDQNLIELTDIHAQPKEIQTPEIKETDLGLELDVDDGEADTDDIILLEDRDVSFIESTITQEQVEAALERVIEKKFAAIIEQNLGEVMEKVLEREIADIRKRLQADLDEMVIS